MPKAKPVPTRIIITTGSHGPKPESVTTVSNKTKTEIIFVPPNTPIPPTTESKTFPILDEILLLKSLTI